MCYWYGSVFFIYISQFVFSIHLEIENVCKVLCTVVAQKYETSLALSSVAQSIKETVNVLIG